MSKDAPSIPFAASKRMQSECNENEFENLPNSVNSAPIRSPLNTIPDPSQCQTEAIRASGSSLSKRIGNSGPNFETSKVSSQVTPARRTSSVGTRLPQYTGGKGGSSSRVSRAIAVASSEPQVEVPCFELVEDLSFWNDHNVQVLIRVRPISSMEQVSQGYGRCLRQESAQTLTWLGHPEIRFTFDHIACEMISQEKLFRVAGIPMVDNCMSGYNSCMFAYGQTGSGKTYTMMGDIGEMDGELNEDCGITPRIFEYLFTRIKEEVENRKDEGLLYSCKCSFLEIYNEQITDLLEPSSTNLHLREDVKKGVYVENLMEYTVCSVDDVLKLLLQGTTNRKIAATHMNSESSRSHSVFTCTIESRWENDSMTHLRFGRLNLVDLAGSERQKSSGAEGDRLREAANINKSLSTLGLVIMSLVDLAHGKHRHVPYRDSRLTFLLQDSLGGNSKTTIIANVSPSICSSNETLSTLKFAQRAKLIQNNAKINEDASGDVTALQRQIQQLKGQLSIMMNKPSIRSVLDFVPSSELSSGDRNRQRDDYSGERHIHDDHNIARKMNGVKATLLGALRREKLAETAARRLEAELEQMNHLAHQREEDAQCTKMMLRFREEKIKRLELLSDGLVSADKYLLDENNALVEEIQLLKARIDRNPELTRFALENIRLLEQLRLFQGFYEQGEREMLLAEVSELRDQLLETLEIGENCGQHNLSSRIEKQDKNALMELEECRNMNSKLLRGVQKSMPLQDSTETKMVSDVSREVDELNSELKRYMHSNQAAMYSVETTPLSSDSADKMASYNQPDNEVQQNKNEHWMGGAKSSDLLQELTEARLLIEAMEREQVCLIEELELVQKDNHRLMEILSNENKLERNSFPDNDNYCTETSKLRNQNLSSAAIGTMDLQIKFEKVTKDLEEARLLSSQYLEDRESQLSREHQNELIREEVEMETAKTILHLQEEVAALQLELQERLSSMVEENKKLRNTAAAKENEMKDLHAEWESASLELTSFLLDGSKSLKDATGQIESIAHSFPHVNVCIGEHIEKAAKVCVEKEERLFLLQKSLEDAQRTILQMEQKLNSLKGATMAFAEVPQSMLSDHPNAIPAENVEEHFSKAGIHQSLIEACANTSALEANDVQVELARTGLMETDHAFNLSCADAETFLSSLQTEIHKAGSFYKQFVQEFVKDIHEIRKTLVEIKENHRIVHIQTVDVPSQEVHKFAKHENQQHVLHQLLDELTKTNGGLNTMKGYINALLSMHGCSIIAEDFVQVEGCTADFSTPGSNLSPIGAGLDKKSVESLFSRCYSSPGKPTADAYSLECDEGPIYYLKNQVDKSEWLIKDVNDNDTPLLCLRKEFMKVYDAFNKLNVHLAALLNEKAARDSAHAEGVGFSKSLELVNAMEQLMFKSSPNQSSLPRMSEALQSSELMKWEAEADCSNTREFVADLRDRQTTSFFTKFEEANATMKEADLMLNALLKANENAKELTGMWKQAGENLMVKRASLVVEIQQLKSLIRMRDRENEELQDKMRYTLAEIQDSISTLEVSFLQMQNNVEKMCKEVYSDASIIAQNILHFICISRFYLEDFCAETMEKGFASFVLHQCHVADFLCKLRNLSSDPGLHLHRLGQGLMYHSGKTLNGDIHTTSPNNRGKEKGEQNKDVRCLETVKLGPDHTNPIIDNWKLQKELDRKDVLLKGLLFDFSLLQESASTRKDIQDESEQLIVNLREVQNELEMKINQLNEVLVQHRKLEGRLADTETALLASTSDLGEAQGTIDILSDQISELRVLLKDLYLKKSEAEEQLEEQRVVVKSLEQEILRLTSTAEKQSLSSIEGIEDDLRTVTCERDSLIEQVGSLHDRLEMAYAVADENEAVAVEARQESEASKMYAEQKEEEVKILERSVEELECTINVMEKKVYEMEEEVERHQVVRDSLELELQALRQRLLTVENFTENRDSDQLNGEPAEDQVSRKLHHRSLELVQAHKQIRLLEVENSEQAKQVKHCKEYISELVLHAEAQASQYQQKYKILEAMVREVNTNSSDLASAVSMVDKTGKSSTRPRGSSSPFRCISSLVQQMNLEKDQELSQARLRIEELDTLAASRQKEICMLSTRLAAAESMTHDVIRDLLGVKLDMTNYANLIDQCQLQKLVEEAQQQTQESIVMEQEVLNLKRQLSDLLEERERCISEVNRREADILAAQLTVEQLQERDQLLTAKNEMLKMDKTNLQRKVAELDDMVKKLFRTQNSQPRAQEQINTSLRPGNYDLSKRLAHSEKLLLRVNDELSHYHKSDGSHPHEKLDMRGLQLKYRKQKAQVG